MAASLNLKIGDSVVVKSGVKDPDLGIDIEGWQGRIVEIEKKDNSVGIAWDSITLKSMPEWIIEKCEVEGLDWRQMNLETTEVEFAKSRDTTKAVEKMIEKLESKHAWDHLDEEGKRIQAVLAGVDPDDEWAAVEAWEKHLRKVLQFPFDAKVFESQDRGPLQYGDKVSVKEITMIDDLYGIIVEVRFGRKKYHFPLCDLEAVDKKQPNYQTVHDFAVWFANR
ncbi:calcium-binding protein [candidate division KSB1 bacterium]|nr:calcium-binding protein [candidate division KSB1 bacterium]